MYIDLSSVNLILVLIAVFWLLIISVLAISLLLGDRSDQKITKGFEHLRKDLEEKTQLLLDAANKDTHTLVTDAITRSETMENETRRILGANQAQFSQELTKLSQYQLELLHKSSDELNKVLQAAIVTEKDQIVSNFHATAVEINKALLVDFDKFKEELNTRTLQVQQDLDAKSEETYRKIREDLDSYRHERVLTLENTILSILQDVASKAFGKVISLQDHKEFVLRALEQSKKENGLKN